MSQQPTAPSSEDRLPSSGESVPPWLTDDQEFEAILNTLDALLERYYEALSEAADSIDTCQMLPLDQDQLVDLGRRMALDKICQRILAAQHELHGATLDVKLARREVSPYRSGVSHAHG
jgi:hypothetical protein